MRIISGNLRGSKLAVPERDGLRPTPDRLRETLFNWLRPCLHGARVLDAFAGTGALGIEALSQGAAHATFVEADAELAKALEGNLKRLKQSSAKVLNGSFERLAGTLIGPFDLVFLDPPFALELWKSAFQKACQHGLLAPGAWIYLEWPGEQAWPLADLPPLKSARAGRSHGGLTRLPQ